MTEEDTITCAACGEPLPVDSIWQTPSEGDYPDETVCERCYHEIVAKNTREEKADA